MNLKRIEILGVPLDCVDMDGALRWSAETIGKGGKGAIFAVNPEKIIRAKADPALKSDLAAAGLLIPDGIGAVVAARLLHGERLSRLPGSELMPALCELARDSGFRVYLFGARPETNARACENLLKTYPGLKIVGARDGYVEETDMAGLISQINELNPQILFVALGSPRQEAWIVENLGGLRVCVCQGVGGTFDVIAGHVKRAPKVFRVMHLEWFYRLCSQPQRILRQKALPSFAARVLAETARRLLNLR